MATSDTCEVDYDLVRHLLLIPATTIVTVLAFLNKRRSYKTNVLDGRPGLVIPLDFLGVDRNRLTISAIFGATTGLIWEVIFGVVNADVSIWSKAFILPGAALEVGLLSFPYFACVTTEHKLVGSIMGLLYTLTRFILELFSLFDKCLASFLKIGIITSIPVIICYLIMLGKFVIVLYHESRKRTSYTAKNKQGENHTSKIEFGKPWVFRYVTDLLNRRFRMPEKKWFRYLRKIYSPESNFQFSTQTLSIFTVCIISVHVFTSLFMHFGRIVVESDADEVTWTIFNPGSCEKFTFYAFGVCLVTSAVLCAVVCVLSLVRFMDCHKNNMLRMFKGDKSFIPKGLAQSQRMIGIYLNYGGFHLGYFIWGMIFVFLILLAVTLVIAYLIQCDKTRNWLWGKVIFAIPGLILSFFMKFLVVVSSLTIFHDYSFPNNVITLDNRVVYMVFSYFLFFLGLPVGFISAILRLAITTALGFFMFPRVDHSIMSDGFQSLDSGFSAYICYIHVQAAHRNPVLRVFCQIVSDLISKPDDSNIRTTKKSRNKWFLLITLIRNPELRAYRKHAMAPPIVKFVKSKDGSLDTWEVEIMTKLSSLQLRDESQAV